MRELWNPTIEDVLEAQELARSRGKGAGANYEAEFIEVMQKKGKKSFARTELNNEELLNDLAQKHGNILKISTDDKGHQTLKIYKNKEEKEDK